MSSPKIVFLVEDQDLVLSILEEGLADAGFAVESANTAEAALARIDEAIMFAALITDIDLGGSVSGWDVAKRARQINPRLPIIYMSGASGDDWASMGVPNSQMLPKPFAIAQIITSVSQMMNEVANLPSSDGQSS